MSIYTELENIAISKLSDFYNFLESMLSSHLTHTVYVITADFSKTTLQDGYRFLSNSRMNDNHVTSPRSENETLILPQDQAVQYMTKLQNAGIRFSFVKGKYLRLPNI